MGDVRFSPDHDIDLMLRFKAGEEDGFREIVKQFERPVINFATGFLKDQEGAEDVAQEVFLEIYRKADVYQPVAKLSTWIFTLARRKCVDFLRRRKIRSAFSLDGVFRSQGEGESTPLIDSAQKTPPDELENREIRQAVREGLAGLPEPQRTALLLSKYEEMSLKEVAQVMKLRVGAVKQLLFRARNNLKERLRPVLQGTEGVR